MIDLRKFGYADGNYWHRNCKTCNKDFIGDKRAYNCRECAKKLYLNNMIEQNKTYSDGNGY